MKHGQSVSCKPSDGVLFVGVTNDLARPIWEHKTKLVPRFDVPPNDCQIEIACRWLVAFSRKALLEEQHAA
jgi:predicted GIY-YIG superfamily endonuclease